MTTAVQHRRGTTAEHSTFTGLEGEVTIDTTKDTAVIHDGSLAGGYPLAKETLANVNPSTLSAITGAATASDDLFLMYDTSALAMKKISRAELNNAITIEALDNVDINGGTIDGTTIGGTTAAAGTFTTLTANTSLTAATADINGGTIDGSAIGGTTPAAGSFTTLSASGAVTLSGGTANGVAYLNGSKVLTSGSALTFDGTNLGVGASSPSVYGKLVSLGGDNATLFAAVGATNMLRVQGYSSTYAGTVIESVNLAQSANTPIFLNSSVTKFGISGSEQMRLTSTGLGIGTSSFSSKLSVQTSDANAWTPDSTVGTQFLYNNSATNNATATTHYQVVYGNSTTGGVKVGAVASNSYSADFVIANRNVGTYQENLRLTYNGNLGLGVIPSAWAGAFKAYQVGNQSLWSTSAGNGYLSNNAFFNTSNQYIYRNTGYATEYIQSIVNGSHAWFTAPSGTAGNAISFTQAMTLDASGNLGLGETSPGSYSKFVVRGGSGNFISYFGASTQTILGDNSGDKGQVGTVSNHPFIFITNATERARIDSSGNLLVGTTSNSFSGSEGIKIRPAGDGANYPRIGLVTAANNDGSNVAFSIYSTSAAGWRMYVGSTGQIYSTSTSISSISDRRFKENIRDLDDGLASVMALSPRKFDWKEGQGRNIKDDRGWIADELKQVFPDLVGTWGQPDEQPEGEAPYESVRPDLIPVLVKAIQEQQAIIEQLKADVAALKGN